MSPASLPPGQPEYCRLSQNPDNGGRETPKARLHIFPGMRRLPPVSLSLLPAKYRAEAVEGYNRRAVLPDFPENQRQRLERPQEYRSNVDGRIESSSHLSLSVHECLSNAITIKRGMRKDRAMQ